MLSSNYYIESGINEIDSASNDILTNVISQIESGFQSIKDMLSSMENDLDQEVKKKYDSVVFMTINYYKKQETNVQKVETTFGDMTDIKCAQSLLIARRCQSSYTEFMTEIEMTKEKYIQSMSSINLNQISQNQWATVINNYDEARKEVLNKTNLYSSIRDAFLYGNGISICQGSANTDAKLLVCILFLIL